MNQLTRCSLLSLLTLSLACPPLSAQPFPNAEDMLLGRWRLDKQRSTFFERQVPDDQVMLFESHEQGMQVTIIFTNQDGEENVVSYVAEQDGVPTALSGSENFDAIIMENRGPYEAFATFTHAGLEVGSAERSISRDGQRMTVEVKRMGDLSSRAVFMKQQDSEAE